MTRRVRRWRRSLSAPAFWAVDAALFAATVAVLLPVVGWPDAFWWVFSVLPFALLVSGFEWMARRDAL